jgi:hypothetical protein
MKNQYEHSRETLRARSILLRERGKAGNSHPTTTKRCSNSPYHTPASARYPNGFLQTTLSSACRLSSLTTFSARSRAPGNISGSSTRSA